MIEAFILFASSISATSAYSPSCKATQMTSDEPPCWRPRYGEKLAPPRIRNLTHPAVWRGLQVSSDASTLED